MKKLIALALIAAFGAFTALTVPAADKKPTDNPAGKKEAPAEKKPARGMPASGKIDSLDKAAKTIKVGDRVFNVTATTKFNSKGKPATFDDAKVGEEVGIYYKEGDGGKLELISLRIGPKPDAKPKEEPKK